MEIREVLDSDADEFKAACGMTRHGNFEAPAHGGLGGKNIVEFVGNIYQRATLTKTCRKLFEAQ